MPRGRAAVFLALAVAVTSCARGADGVTFYVLASKADAPSFPEILAALARQRSLVANVGHTTDEQGRKFYAVEAKGLRLRVWAQNMPLDPAPVCAHTAGLEVDPRYFVVEVEPSFKLPGRRDAEIEAAALQQSLAKAGFSVQAVAARCGSTDP